MKKDGLSTIVKELENASKMHLKQSKKIEGHIDDMKSPASRASKDWIQGVTKTLKLEALKAFALVINMEVTVVLQEVKGTI